eukprot:UN17499
MDVQTLFQKSSLKCIMEGSFQQKYQCSDKILFLSLTSAD